MNQSVDGLVEMVVSFGIILAFLIWQLIATRRSIRRDRQKEAEEAKVAERKTSET